MAERTVAAGRNGGRSEEIDKLLVHAFLEDLRQAYARPFWSVRGRRRTAYPVALIDGAAPGDGEDAGERLLELVNDVRVETGEWDPLLVVYAGARPSARIAEAGPEAPLVLPLEDLDTTGPGRAAGKDEPDWRPSPHPPTAWYRPVELSEPGDTGGTGEAGRYRPVEAPPPPWYAHRAFAVVSCLALLVPLLGWVGYRLGGPDCLYRPFSGQVSVRSMADECVGYSDSDAFRFNDQAGQEKLQQVQKKIFAQNREVRDAWERSERRRPYVTLVYLGTLTGRETSRKEEAYAAERQELEGLAIAQYHGLQESGTAYDVPLLHIVVANAGFQMEHADPVVDMIADLAREERDAPVVGVVGLVESRTSTVEALERLGRVGIPAVAPTLSGEGMYKSSPLYLQIASPNREQARMVDEYGKALSLPGTRVYYTVGERSKLPDDLYVSTLVAELRKQVDNLEYTEEFTGRGLTRECGYRGMLFFAGRWSEFPDFLRKLDRSCGDDQPHHLVADDSVNRYMANPLLRGSAPAGLPLVFASKAPLATCEELRSRAREGRDRAAGTFLRLIGEDRDGGTLDPPRCAGGGSDAPDEPVGERVGLAYDSAKLLLRAVETLTARIRLSDDSWNPRLITPTAVHTEVLHQNGHNPFWGATGRIEFHRDGGEPIGRAISFMRVENITDVDERPREVFRCQGAKEDGRTDCERPRR
ncbi:hypothetical protein F0L17_23065 [Streptomyces sp. TRM43335]|uniref:Uncharacterized protein n=1 Tax=Streptomyces taklimakanensis TaxID=2569853 RepID=A0A6G2BI65_9ACTN|nr:hypothetical protein [Streptomyces taklimakanensis]MTE21940.1 hypothetical protein [Streptomyces taklimakanensis]